MQSSDSFLRQLSGKEALKSSSTRWGNNNSSKLGHGGVYGSRDDEILNNGLVMRRKRVMVVVDDSSHSKHAMLWALTHVANEGDFLTLLHISPVSDQGLSDSSSFYDPHLATSLGSLCKTCKPEVEVEALVVQGPKLATVMSQVKKLDVSVLVLGQKRPSTFLNCFCGTSGGREGFVEECINSVECLTIGVRKQRRGMGGYLISTRWQKNFWQLA